MTILQRPDGVHNAFKNVEYEGRFRRLEAAAGNISSGGGSAGPDSGFYSTSLGAVTSVLAGTWRSMAMPPTYAMTADNPVTIQPDNRSFKITYSGRYVIKATIEGPTAVAGVRLLGMMTINAAIDVDPGVNRLALVEPENFTTASANPRFDILGVRSLSAGDIIRVNTYANPGYDLHIIDLSVARINGVKGDTGPAGPPASAAIPLDPWHTVGAVGEPPFLNGWQVLGGYGPVAFRKDPLGRVRLRGTIQSGANITVAFTLPVGYRPTSPVRTVVISNQQAPGQWEGQINVGTDGNVLCYMTNVNGLLALDQISFDTDTVTAMPVGPAGPVGPTGPTGPAASSAIPIDPWHTVGAVGEPAFVNGWGASSVQFRKDPFGRVWITGPITTSGPTGTVAFTLPVGYRPAVSRYYDSLGGGGNSFCWVFVDSATGGVTINYTVGGPWLDLSFDTGTVTTAGVGPKGDKGDTGAQGPQGPAASSAIALEGWHTVGLTGEPAYQNGWQTYAGWTPAAFRKDPFGKVQLRGLVRSGAVGTVIFTLPVGYRPSVPLIIDAQSGEANGNARMGIGSDGTIVLVSLGAGADGQFLSLWGINFDTDTVTTYGVGPAGPQGPVGPQGLKGDPGAYADPLVQRRQNIGAASQSAAGNGVALIYNTANAPYIDLTAGTWRIEAAAACFSNVADLCSIGLYDETLGTGVALSAGAASVTGPVAGASGYGDPRTAVTMTVTGPKRLRIWVIPSGTSTMTVTAAGNVPTAYMMAYLIGPGQTGPTGPAEGIQVVNALPAIAGLANGYQVLLKSNPAVDTSPLWRCYLDLNITSDNYKWRVMGGESLYDRKSTPGTPTSTGPQDIPGGSASVILPVNGYYELHTEADAMSGIAGQYLYITQSCNGINPGDNTYTAETVEKIIAVTNTSLVTAGVAKNQMTTSGSTTAGRTFWNSIRARPIRLLAA